MHGVLLNTGAPPQRSARRSPSVVAIAGAFSPTQGLTPKEISTERSGVIMRANSGCAWNKGCAIERLNNAACKRHGPVTFAPPAGDRTALSRRAWRRLPRSTAIRSRTASSGPMSWLCSQRSVRSSINRTTKWLSNRWRIPSCAQAPFQGPYRVRSHGVPPFADTQWLVTASGGGDRGRSSQVGRNGQAGRRPSGRHRASRGKLIPPGRPVAQSGQRFDPAV